MITEGVLMYLSAGTVEAIAAESAAHSSVAHWISDVTTTGFTNALGGQRTMDSLRHVRASDCLAGEQILEVLQNHGWKTATHKSYITDTGFTRERVLRLTGGNPPPPPPYPQGDPTGVHHFVRG